jgi:hypothetical protein
MSSEESPDRRRAIPTQRGRNRHKVGGALQRLGACPILVLIFLFILGRAPAVACKATRRPIGEPVPAPALRKADAQWERTLSCDSGPRNPGGSPGSRAGAWDPEPPR